VKRSYLETFFRHRVLVTAPLLAALVLAGFYGTSAPRKYAAAVTVFADTAITSDSTLDTGSTSNTTPAANQQAIFTEFLGTRSFLLQVMQQGPGADRFAHLNADAQDAALAALAKSVTITAAGPHVLTISLRDTDPQVHEVANLVATTLIATERGALSDRYHSQVDYDRRQVSAAANDLKDARNALQKQGAHASDAVLSQLTGAVTQAQQQYSDASAQLAKSSAALAQVDDDSVLRVVDKADRSVPQARRKGLIFAGAGGLLGGSAISLCLLMLLTAADRSVRRSVDLEQSLGLNVVGITGEFSRRSRPRVKAS
jgi:uncharacterized protein involved in exopolysaccharide biosynthesis